MSRLSRQSDVSRSNTAPPEEVIIAQSPSRPQSSGSLNRAGSTSDYVVNGKSYFGAGVELELCVLYGIVVTGL